MFQLRNCTISWKVCKQCSVAASTTEAEYIALALTARQMIWYKNGLSELLIPSVPRALRCDNTAAIKLAENPVLSDRSRHIDIQYHFTRERLLNGDFTVVYVGTRDNLADICTKALTKDLHYTLARQIQGNK